ncbi:MAG: arginine--tRNA ligase [Hyphomicrobiales bacterium]
MLEQLITSNTIKAIQKLYGVEIKENLISLQNTRPDIEGDITLVVFPFLRMSKKGPEQTAEEIGSFLSENVEEIESYSVIKGFLNLVVSNNYWLNFFNENAVIPTYGYRETKDEDPFVIEYSSPNTNKPLHLGHIRNNLLGWSIAQILKANGRNVKKVNLVNDRGIHICKSMLAWLKYGNGATPESTGIKGDKFVGDYYVRFDQEYKKEIATLVEGGMEKEDAEKNAPLIKEAREMLKKWEINDPEVRSLWEKMNAWVYEGFDVTYNRMGIDFDKIYYESDTYLLGKALVEDGLKNGVLFKKDDNSIWCDLEDRNLDQKLLLRGDGTSVYMTQDLGTAEQRYDEFHPQKLMYVVGNEQNYHFDVLKIILDKLGKDWAEKIHHISYGMVELPHGKMKSREGTVVDADDLMSEMFNTAKTTTEELGKIDGLSEDEANGLFRKISLGALKYFMLKVDPKKTMLFNPAESIDFNGNTGPFVQYTYARIQSIIRKSADVGLNNYSIQHNVPLERKEKELLKTLSQFSEVINQAATTFSPAVIANYIYSLVKEYNSFYHDFSVLKEENKDKALFRVALSAFTSLVIKNGMALLGIEVPNKM